MEGMHLCRLHNQQQRTLQLFWKTQHDAVSSFKKLQKDTTDLINDINSLYTKDDGHITIGTIKAICKRLDNEKDDYISQKWNNPSVKPGIYALRQLAKMRNTITEDASDEDLICIVTCNKISTRAQY